MKKILKYTLLIVIVIALLVNYQVYAKADLDSVNLSPEIEDEQSPSTMPPIDGGESHEVTNNKPEKKTWVEIKTDREAKMEDLKAKHEDARAELEAKRAEQKTAVAEKIQAHQENIQQKRAQLSYKHAERLQQRYEFYYERLSQLIEKTESLIEKLTEKGYDLSSPSATLSGLKSMLESAQQSGEDAGDAFNAISENDEVDAQKAAYKTAASLGQTARDGYRSCRQILQGVLQEIREIVGNNSDNIHKNNQDASAEADLE
jgi:chromosome segregation ATPase